VVIGYFREWLRAQTRMNTKEVLVRPPHQSRPQREKLMTSIDPEVIALVNACATYKFCENGDRDEVNPIAQSITRRLSPDREAVRKAIYSGVLSVHTGALMVDLNRAIDAATEHVMDLFAQSSADGETTTDDPYEGWTFADTQN
jgi:hypothetical protein